MRRPVILLILVLAVSSCGMYGRVKMEQNQTQSDIPSLKDVYKDPILLTLIDSALSRNVDVRIAEQRVLQARASLQNCYLSFLPSAEIGYRGTKVYWNLDLFGKNLNATRASKEAFVSSEFMQRSVRSKLVAQIATSYVSLLLADEQLRIGQNSLENWIQTEKVLQALKLSDSGVSEVAVLQAKAQRLDLESSLHALKQSCTEIQNQICSMLGTEPCEIDRGELRDFTLCPELCDSIPFDYVSNRPDVQAALHDYLQKSYLKQKAVSSYFPSVSITASMDWNLISDIVYSFFRPIFDNGNRSADLKKAKAEQEISRLNFQQALVNAAVDVSNSLSAVDNARNSVRIDSEQVDILCSAVQKTEMLMQYSTVNYLEVLSERQSLLAAQQSLARDRFDEYCGIISLYFSLGGGQ